MGKPVDPYRYFAERGADMIRIRLWHTPENTQSSCGQPIRTNELEDVLLAARRIDSAGMDMKLAIHYGDYFVDPGKQRRPRAWDGVEGHDLIDSIYDYTYRVLDRLYAQGTPPAIVAVGNETDNGFVDNTAPTDGFDWAQDGPKFQAGLRAVRDFNANRQTRTRSALHLTEGYVEFGVAELRRQGVMDFDILGVSYYPHFNPGVTVADMGRLVARLTATYPYEVMVFETGFSWNNVSGSDEYGNFLGGNGDVVAYPATPGGQRDFLLDLREAVCTNGGSGILYWEPAWVTSEMCDAYGRGSSYENAAFFDYAGRPLPAFDFFGDAPTATEREPEWAVELQIVGKNNRYQLSSPVPITSWTLVDSVGRIVGNGRSAGGTREWTLDGRSWTAGIYYLRVWGVRGGSVTRAIRVMD
jgi:arabinogalactan endo-1,4-beta-galactosidase